MRRIAIVLLLVLPAWSAPPATRKKPAAPAPASTVQSWPIESITVEGSKIYPADRIIAASGLKIGQTAGKKEFEAARDRLIATGAFSSVGYKFAPTAGKQGFAASFQVQEIEQVYPYKIEGLPADKKVIADALANNEPLFKDLIPGTQEVISRIDKEVEAELQKLGHPDKVKGKLSAEADGKLVLVFRPARLASIAEVYFVGNKEIPTPVLQSSIAGVAVGALYTPENMRQLLDTSIRPLYEEKGKLKVSFPKLATGKADKVDGIAVTVTVDEGPTYKIGEAAIAGPRAGDQRLMKEAAIKPGELANMTEIKAGIDRMEKLLRRQGYMRVTTTTDRHLNDKTGTCDFTFRIEPGEQFKFGNLTIDGLDIETEPEIRKMWGMKAGQAYNADYPYYFLRRIEEDQVFENLGKTRTALHIDDEARLVDVTLYFSTNGKPLPAIGPAREQLEHQRRAEEKSRDVGLPPGK